MAPRRFFRSTRRAQRSANTSQPFFQPATMESEQSASNDNFFAPSPVAVQTKPLTVGQPGDQYEQEADRVADQVVSQSPDAPATGIQRAEMKEEEKVQRAEMKEEEKASVGEIKEKEEEEQVQRAELKKEEKDQPAIQKSDAGGGTTVSPGVAASLQQRKGGGTPMPPTTQREMSAAFGQDFSTVRIHTDAAAESLSQSLNAQAFTLGKDVYFNKGKFSPDTREGKHLLAHELTHVGQQTEMVNLKLRDGHDLQASRFAGDLTLEGCFDGEAVHYLRSGSRGSAVVRLQQALVDLGYPMPISTQKTGTPDGIFGPETQATVKKFQQDSGLAADGVVGRDTMTALDTRFAGGGPPAPGPTPGPTPPAPVLITSLTEKGAPDGTPDTRTKVGVGEIVELTGSVAGTWTASAGRFLEPNGGATNRWQAPATGTSVFISLNAGGVTGALSFSVVAPNELSMVKRSEDALTAGVAGVCMNTDVTVKPLDVNLGATQWLEVPGPATNIAGYFRRFSAATLYHHPNPRYLAFNDLNTGLVDHAAWHAVPGPYSMGQFQWVIPNKYKVDGEPDASGRLFTTTTQLFMMFNSAGMMGVSKAGANSLRTP